MSFMEEYSTDSDGLSHCSSMSPRSTATDATSISTYQESHGCQKRKRDAMVMLPRKKSRTGPCFDGNAFLVDIGLRTTSIDLLQNRGTDESLYRHADSEAECATGKIPTAVWKSVFMYLPPRCLGTLLSVNSVFHMMLTGSSPKPGGGHLSREFIHKDAERIWTLARQRHHPHLPRPLHGYRELDMWKLIGSSQCQFCVHSLGSPLQASNDLVGNHLTFQESPRTDIHWPLAVRSCHECLGKHFLTESELGSSKLAYLIPSMNNTVLKHSPWSPFFAPASGSKIFLRSHLEWLHAESRRIAHKTNFVTAEGWLKTYEVNARKRQRDASRWERWEATNERVKLFPKTIGLGPRHVMSGASSPASTYQSSPTPPSETVVCQAELSGRQSSASSSGSMPPKGKTGKGRRRRQRQQAGNAQTGLTAQAAEFAPALSRAARLIANDGLPAITQTSLRLERRKDSIRPEGFKIECDDPQPYPTSKSDQWRQHVYRPEVEPACQLEPGRRSWLDDARYYDHPRPTTRSRSRSPVSDRRCLVDTTRERDYQTGRHFPSPAHPPVVNSRVAPIRRDEGRDHLYDYPAQQVAARYVPRVLYDGYGNEYVRTAPREPNPCVVYAVPPARGY